MLRLLQRLFSDEAGQGLAEYALIIALIALVVIGTLMPCWVIRSRKF